MPVCVHCAHWAPFSYTIYKTRSNIRLAACDRCQGFVDPLIEHPALVILLDLILLKPRVFLHLLYNRGSAPYHAVPPCEPIPSSTTLPSGRRPRAVERSHAMTDHLVRLLLLSVVVETATRLLPSTARPGSTDLSAPGIAVQLVLVMVEIVTQHIVTGALALLALRLRGWWPLQSQEKGSAKGEVDMDGRRLDFLPQVIPLTLLYTSVIPSLLQLVLSIWSNPPLSTSESLSAPGSSASSLLLTDLLAALPASIAQHIPPSIVHTVKDTEAALRSAWGETDKMWAGTRLLGGMSAGFGLRVVLPTRPWETTGIVLTGWAAAHYAGRLAGEYLGYSPGG